MLLNQQQNQSFSQNNQTQSKINENSDDSLSKSKQYKKIRIKVFSLLILILVLIAVILVQWCNIKEEHNKTFSMTNSEYKDNFAEHLLFSNKNKSQNKPQNKPENISQKIILPKQQFLFGQQKNQQNLLENAEKNFQYKNKTSQLIIETKQLKTEVISSQLYEQNQQKESQQKNYEKTDFDIINGKQSVDLDDQNAQNSLEGAATEEVAEFINQKYALNQIQDSEIRVVEMKLKLNNSNVDNFSVTSQKTQKSTLDQSFPKPQNGKEAMVITSQKQNASEVNNKPVYSQKDLYDPIIKRKNQIQQNLKGKFEDLIYIKKNTKITPEQYKKSKQRMSIWKYFNPLTRNIQFLDEVSYEPEILISNESKQQQIKKIKQIITEQKDQYEKKYNISRYKEIGFCIIVPSYKNKDKFVRNLNSMFQQDYQNYHIIYIDDASKDGTQQKIRQFLKKYKIPSSKLRFIQNKINKKALPNIDYAARKLCHNGQIMTIVDGDDYLIGTQVFKVINAQYQGKQLLMLYSNHLRVHEPIYLKVGTSAEYPESIKKSKAYRKFSVFPISHLRTFYVDVYKRIKPRDLKDYKGQYFAAANDFAIMMPIVQMVGDRFQYLPQLTYVYDSGTGLNNFETKAAIQAQNYRITKRRHKYPKIIKKLNLQSKNKLIKQSLK